MPSKRLRVLLTFTRVAHDLAGHRKEVGAAMPFLLFVVHEPQIRFMDQSGGLKGMSIAFLS